MTRACMHVHGVAWPPQQKDMDTRCVQMYLVSYPCKHDLSGRGTEPPLGGSGGMLPREDFFLNVEVKSINLVHFESNIRRSMDTPLNTRMKQNCKQILFFFMDILQIPPLSNSILVY